MYLRLQQGQSKENHNINTNSVALVTLVSIGTSGFVSLTIITFVHAHVHSRRIIPDAVGRTMRH